MKPKTYCEKWPTGCQLCDLLLCDGKKESAFKRQRSANNILFRMIGVNPMKCDPCKPTQPECGECEFAKPITNADRIRAMTDEKLAEWIASVAQGGDGSCAPGCHACNGKTSCTESWMEWLRQEAHDEP